MPLESERGTVQQRGRAERSSSKVNFRQSLLPWATLDLLEGIFQILWLTLLWNYKQPHCRSAAERAVAVGIGSPAVAYSQSLHRHPSFAVGKSTRHVNVILACEQLSSGMHTHCPTRASPPFPMDANDSDFWSFQIRHRHGQRPLSGLVTPMVLSSKASPSQPSLSLMTPSQTTST